MRAHVKVAISIFLILVSASANVTAVLWSLWKAPVTIRIDPLTPRSSNLNVSCAPSAILPGDITTISGRLCNATSKEAILGQNIQLYYTLSGSYSWAYIASVLTSEDGSFTYEWHGASLLSLRSYSVNATFLGNAEFDPWTAVTDLQVEAFPVGFSLSISPKTETMSVGSSKTFSIELTFDEGFTSQVTLTISGLATGVSAEFNPSAISPTPGEHGISELTISSTMSAIPNTYVLTIKGSTEIIERISHLYLTLKASPDMYRIAEYKKLNDENVYLWQTVSYKETVYSIFLYSKSEFAEFSIQDQYIDNPIVGPLRIQATDLQGKQWVNIEGVIAIDENGNIVKEDEILRIILTLAEAQAYYCYISQEQLKKQDFSSFLETVAQTVSDAYSNPLFWPTLLAYHTPPPTSVKLYKELLLSIYAKDNADHSVWTGAAKHNVNRYISYSTKVIDHAAEYLELQNYKQFLSNSHELQQIIGESDYLSKLDRNLKDLFDELEAYKPYSVPGKYFIKFLIGVALEKTAAEEIMPYLKALKNYIQTNPKSSYDPEWSSLLEALEYTIDIAQGSNSLWKKIAFEAFDVAIEYIWDEAIKKVIVEGIKEITKEIALHYGLSAGAIGSIMTSISLGVGIGVIVGDILFDLTSFYRNMDLMVKAKNLNAIVKEMYGKICSSEITTIEANIETRKLQFSLLIKTYELLAENADGAGISGVMRQLLNALVDLVKKALGQDVQTTEEYIDKLREIFIPYYSFLRSLSVPPLHYVKLYEPKWQPYHYSTSSTAVIDNMMFVLRGLDDPGLIAFLEIDHYWFHFDEIGNINITLVNPSPINIDHIWINATVNSRIGITPETVYLDTIQALSNTTFNFQFTFNQPGTHALSFWIIAENGTYAYFESAIVESYLPGLNVTMNPSAPLLNDNVFVQVSNSSNFSLSNSTVLIQSPFGLTTHLTNASGMTNFQANTTGLWSISVIYPSEPTYGPIQFVVSSSEMSKFQLEINGVNASRISPNRTYCKGFRVVNFGANNLHLQIELVEDTSWLTSWVLPVFHDGFSYKNVTILNNTMVEGVLPSGHWTSGYVVFFVETNATLGLQTTLTLNASVIGSPEFRQEDFNITVDAEQLSISFSELGVLYHGEDLSVSIRIEDRHGNLTSPDMIAARLDNLNLTAFVSQIIPGLFNLTFPNINSGDHTLEVSVWKTNFENMSTLLPVYVEKRNLNIQLKATRNNSILNLIVRLVDTVSLRNMTGANVWGVLEDREGDKTTVFFTEIQPENYTAFVDITQYDPTTQFNLAIYASKIGYSTQTLALRIIGTWTTSLQGLGGYPIVDFALYNGNLYAASDSTLYKYDGDSWNIISAPTFVLSIEPYEDKLILGGQGGLYSYNSTTFNLIFNVSNYIKPLGAYNNTLYAGTVLDNPPTLYYCNGSAENPANWHIDTAFSTILNFSGPFGSIDSFTAYNNTMYVTSGGTVFSYNGTYWSITKTYDDANALLDMKIYNGKLYLATRDQGWRKPIYQGYSGFSGRIIEFDGNNWTTIFDHDYWIYSLETYDSKLYAGTANKIYTYNGTDWETSFHSEEGVYYAISMITYDGKIYAGMGNGYILEDPSLEALTTETIVVPEFPLSGTLLLFMITTLLAVIIYSRKQSHFRILKNKA